MSHNKSKSTKILYYAFAFQKSAVKLTFPQKPDNMYAKKWK